MDLQESLQRALRYLQNGAPAECARSCDDILLESPGLIQALYLRGCAAFETGDIARSVADLEVVHDNHPAHLQAAYYLGRSLRASGKLEEALAPLEAALGEERLAVQAHYELAICLARLRRRPEAIEHYKAILVLQRDNAQVAANLASLLERENRLGESASWTEKALVMDPTSEMARMTRATLDRRNGKYPQAIQELRSLLPGINDPINRSIAWNQLGQSLEGQEEWNNAFDAFSESNRILHKHHTGSRPDPRGPHSLQTLARIREWLKKTPVAAWNESATHDTGGIVFLVGFPRSGTTLTPAKEVCRRLLASKGLIRIKRCTPFSARR